MWSLRLCGNSYKYHDYPMITNKCNILQDDLVMNIIGGYFMMIVYWS